MIVMLSLMLSACGKSPARRDGDSNAEIVSLEKLDISTTQTQGERTWSDSLIETFSVVNPWSKYNEKKSRGQYFSGLVPGPITSWTTVNQAGLLGALPYFIAGIVLGTIYLNGGLKGWREWGVVVKAATIGACGLGGVGGFVVGRISAIKSEEAKDDPKTTMLRAFGNGLLGGFAGAIVGAAVGAGVGARIDKIREWVELKAAEAEREWQTEQDVAKAMRKAEKRVRREEEGVLLCARASYPFGLVRREEEETVEEWAERVQDEQLWEARVLQSHVRVWKAEARMRKAEERAREVQERVRKGLCMAIYEERTRAEAARAREELERVWRAEKRWRWRLNGERWQARREAQERKRRAEAQARRAVEQKHAEVMGQLRQVTRQAQARPHEVIERARQQAWRVMIERVLQAEMRNPERLAKARAWLEERVVEQVQKNMEKMHLMSVKQVNLAWIEGALRKEMQRQEQGEAKREEDMREQVRQIRNQVRLADEREAKVVREQGRQAWNEEFFQDLEKQELPSLLIVTDQEQMERERFLELKKTLEKTGFLRYGEQAELKKFRESEDYQQPQKAR